MVMKTNGNSRQADLSHADSFEPFRSAGTLVKRTRTLLIVGDDPAVRQLEAEILSREGYKVLQARSAEEALSVAREVGVIHLLITDVSMPQVDASELSHRFRKVHPRTPVLMISSSLRWLRDATRELDRAVLLAKPFKLNELLDKVRTLLDAPFLVRRIRTPWAHD